jgi:hypothetical protein
MASSSVQKKSLKRAFKIVVDVGNYGTSEGFAAQITLPSGKFLYTGVQSILSVCAKKKGVPCKTVHYYGACIFFNINDRAHDGFPIQIDGVSVADFLDKIATKQECLEAEI